MRIVHLSDLHFGRDRPELEAPLIERVNDLNADLVVISGDYTQRARVSQFERSRAFLDRIDAPTLSVPGNHDTPLDNLFMRFLRPFSRYKRYIDRNLEPTHETDDAVVLGVNTVNRFAWQRGKLSSRTISRIRSGLRSAGDRLRVVVLHHPLEHGPDVEKRLMEGAHETLTALKEAGADVVLSGHLHYTVTQPFAIAPGCLFVQAGTSLSDRVRGEYNAFNLLAADRTQVRVETFAVGEDETRFDRIRTAGFSRDEGGVWASTPD